jgi:hypothetical protein
MKVTTGILLFFIIVGLNACITQAKIQYYDFPSEITGKAKIANAKILE